VTGKETALGLLSRILLVLRIKTSAALDRSEDPRQVLDFADGHQRELLRQLGRGLVEVAAARHQLEGQAAGLRERVPALEHQARHGLDAGREDLARLALQRKHQALLDLEDLDRQLAELADEERGLAATRQRLATEIEAFRSRSRTTSARYAAAEARAKAGEALTGLSGDLAELGMALGRAEEKTRRMRARAGALDALTSGDLSAAALGGDDLEHGLRAILLDRAVAEDLATLRAGPGAEGPAALQPGDADERRAGP
jgi:phage shock protein A